MSGWWHYTLPGVLRGSTCAPEANGLRITTAHRQSNLMWCRNCWMCYRLRMMILTISLQLDILRNKSSFHGPFSCSCSWDFSTLYYVFQGAVVWSTYQNCIGFRQFPYLHQSFCSSTVWVSGATLFPTEGAGCKWPSKSFYAIHIFLQLPELFNSVNSLLTWRFFPYRHMIWYLVLTG